MGAEGLRRAGGGGAAQVDSSFRNQCAVAKSGCRMNST